MNEGVTYGEAGAIAIKMRQSLAKAVLDVCRSDVSFMAQARIDGLIGITLDNTRIILVNICELLQKASQTPAVGPFSLTPASRSVAVTKSCYKSVDLLPALTQQQPPLHENEQQKQQSGVLNKEVQLIQVKGKQVQMIRTERQQLNNQQQVLPGDKQQSLVLHGVEQQKQLNLLGNEQPVVQIEELKHKQYIQGVEQRNLLQSQHSSNQAITEQYTLLQQSRVLPGPVSQVLPNSVSQVLPSSVSQVLPSSVSQVLPTIVSQVLPCSVSQVLPSSLFQVQPSSVAQVLPSSVSEVLPSSASQVLPISVAQKSQNVQQMNSHLQQKPTTVEPLQPPQILDQAKRTTVQQLLGFRPANKGQQGKQLLGVDQASTNQQQQQLLSLERANTYQQQQQLLVAGPVNAKQRQPILVVNFANANQQQQQLLGLDLASSGQQQQLLDLHRANASQGHLLGVSSASTKQQQELPGVDSTNRKQQQQLLSLDQANASQQQLLGIVSASTNQQQNKLLDVDSTNAKQQQQSGVGQATVSQQQQQASITQRLLGVDQTSQVKQQQLPLGDPLGGQTSKDQRLQELLELTQASSTQLQQLLQTDTAKQQVQQLLGFDLASISQLPQACQIEQLLGLGATSNDLLKQIADPIRQQLSQLLGLDRINLGQQLGLDGVTGASLLSDIESIKRQLQEMNNSRAGSVSSHPSATPGESSKNSSEASMSGRRSSSSTTGRNNSSGYFSTQCSTTEKDTANITSQANLPSHLSQTEGGKLATRDTIRPVVVIKTDVGDDEMNYSPEHSPSEYSTYSAVEYGTSPGISLGNLTGSCSAVEIKQEIVEISESEDEVESFYRPREMNLSTQCYAEVLPSTSVRQDVTETDKFSIMTANSYKSSSDLKTGVQVLNKRKKKRRVARSTAKRFTCPHCARSLGSKYFLNFHIKICQGATLAESNYEHESTLSSTSVTSKDESTVQQGENINEGASRFKRGMKKLLQAIKAGKIFLKIKRVSAYGKCMLHCPFCSMRLSTLGFSKHTMAKHGLRITSAIGNSNPSQDETTGMNGLWVTVKAMPDILSKCQLAGDKNLSMALKSYLDAESKKGPDDNDGVNDADDTASVLSFTSSARATCSATRGRRRSASSTRSDLPSTAAERSDVDSVMLNTPTFQRNQIDLAYDSNSDQFSLMDIKKVLKRGKVILRVKKTDDTGKYVFVCPYCKITPFSVTGIRVHMALKHGIRVASRVIKPSLSEDGFRLIPSVQCVSIEGASGLRRKGLHSSTDRNIATTRCTTASSVKMNKLQKALDDRDEKEQEESDDSDNFQTSKDKPWVPYKKSVKKVVGSQLRRGSFKRTVVSSTLRGRYKARNYAVIGQRFCCSYCSRSYTLRYNLSRHMKEAHDKQLPHINAWISTDLRKALSDRRNILSTTIFNTSQKYLTENQIKKEVGEEQEEHRSRVTAPDHRTQGLDNEEVKRPNDSDIEQRSKNESWVSYKSSVKKNKIGSKLIRGLGSYRRTQISSSLRGSYKVMETTQTTQRSQCSDCSKSYSCRYSLSLHMKAVHNKKLPRLNPWVSSGVRKVLNNRGNILSTAIFHGSLKHQAESKVEEDLEVDNEEEHRSQVTTPDRQARSFDNEDEKGLDNSDAGQRMKYEPWIPSRSSVKKNQTSSLQVQQCDSFEKSLGSSSPRGSCKAVNSSPIGSRSQCSYCSKSYSYRYSLSMHMRMVHNQKLPRLNSTRSSFVDALALDNSRNIFSTTVSNINQKQQTENQVEKNMEEMNEEELPLQATHNDESKTRRVILLKAKKASLSGDCVFICPYCVRTSSSIVGIKKHLTCKHGMQVSSGISKLSLSEDGLTVIPVVQRIEVEPVADIKQNSIPIVLLENLNVAGVNYKCQNE